MGGRERANLTRPRRARLTAATMSRSITTRHLPHQSLRSSCLSDWSLSASPPAYVREPSEDTLSEPLNPFSKSPFAVGAESMLGNHGYLAAPRTFPGPPALVRGGW